MTMFTATEKKNLKQLLACAVNKDEVLSLYGLHGFLYGLVIIPEPVMPSEWLPGIFGEEMLELDSEEQGDQMMGNLFTVYNRMTLENDDGELQFPFDYESIKTKDVQRIREWARGFFLSTSLRPYIWGMPDDEELDDGLYEDGPLDDEDFDGDDAEITVCYAVVMGVAFPERIAELFEHDEGNLIPLDKDDPELEAKLFAMLPDAVLGLQEYANGVSEAMEALKADNYFPEPPKPRKVEKIGRNDLCPCGSGSKYKKCCGK